MRKKEIVAKVVEKLSSILSNEIKKKIPDLIEKLKKAKSNKALDLLEDFKKIYELSTKQYAEVLTKAIDAKVFLKEDGSIDISKRKELKKITDHPPIKIYFDRLY